MERLRLWRYKKLTNEIVKEKKVIEKHSDDEDFNSCFKLRKTLKSSCRNFIMNHQEKQMSSGKFSTNKDEEKIIEKLKEQRSALEAKEQDRKTFHKCLHKILNRTSSHQVDEHKILEERSSNAYEASGIYERFGNSCVDSLKQKRLRREIETEDLSSASWYHSGTAKNFGTELLENQIPGSFIIQRASKKSGNYILSLRVLEPSKAIVHHIIVQSKQGYRLKGAKKIFPTLSSLVTHHSVMSEQLPLTLHLHRTFEVSKTSDDFCPLNDLELVFTNLEI